MALGQRSSQYATEFHKRQSVKQEDEEVDPSSFQGTAVMRQMTLEEEVLPVQPRRLLFFPPSIPWILQAAVRDLDMPTGESLGVDWCWRAF